MCSLVLCHFIPDEAGIELATGDNIGIVAIGNAPMALLRTMKLMDEGRFSPALVIGGQSDL